MGERTAIDWTEATWNPWTGCTKVSPGCAHCYMFRDKMRFGQNPEIVQRSKTTFNNPLRWKEPRIIFTCSWSDWFHEGADAWRDDAWDVIRRTPQHTFQILTKRPERIAEQLPADWGAGWPNVWLGVSVENQRWLSRVDVLGTVDAAVRFISAEPLLSPLPTLGAALTRNCIAWVIAGGESGPRHRPCETDWLREIRNQCQTAGVAFFLKQLGGSPDARAHEKAILDGRTWTDMPRITLSSTVEVQAMARKKSDTVPATLKLLKFPKVEGGDVKHPPKHVADALSASAAEPDVEDDELPVERPVQAEESLWPEAVNGAALLDEVVAAFKRYVAYSNEHSVIASALWVAHTYLTDVTSITPYLLVTAPASGCGKSRQMDVLANLVHNPSQDESITAAALYRAIDPEHRPTLLLDEVDRFFRRMPALWGILNSGYKSNGRVSVCERGHTVHYSTFCAKALSGIGSDRIWETVTNRSIPIRLHEASEEEQRGLTDTDDLNALSAELRPLRRKLLRWSADIRSVLATAKPAIPDRLRSGTHARPAQLWRPLFAIADAAGGAWPTNAREAAWTLHGTTKETDPRRLLLRLLYDLSEERNDDGTPKYRHHEFIKTATIISECETRIDAPQLTGAGLGGKAKTLAELLDPFDIRPEHHRFPDGTHMGYRVDTNMNAMFRRYLRVTPQKSTTSTTALSRDAEVVVDVVDERGATPNVKGKAIGHQKGKAKGKGRIVRRGKPDAEWL